MREPLFESFDSKQHSFVTFTQEQVVVNGVAHVIGDIPATNGLVHVIDQMIPVSKRLIELNTVWYVVVNDQDRGPVNNEQVHFLFM